MDSVGLVHAAAFHMRARCRRGLALALSLIVMCSAQLGLAGELRTAVASGRTFGSVAVSWGMVCRCPTAPDQQRGAAGGAVGNMASGLAHTVAHPWQTTIAFASAHLHPWRTALALADTVATWATQLATANSYDQGQLLGRAGTDLATLFLTAGTGAAVKATSTIERLGVVGEIGRAARGAASAERLVIGRGADLAKRGALLPGEFRLSWKATETAKSEWKLNSGFLRQEMRELRPIRDASPGDLRGMYFNAERNLLKSRGWTLDKLTNLWMPPMGMR